MKMKNTMTKRFQYDYNELDSLAEYLEKQAAEGWELTSKTGVMLGFRRCEPRKVKISVELVYPDDNDWDNQRYIEYCQAAGWKHIFEDGKLQIFENEDLDAVPISTDPELKLRTVHRKCMKSTLIAPFVAALICGYILIKINSISDYTTYLNCYGLIGALFLPLMLGVLIFLSGNYLSWYRQAKKGVETGSHPVYKKKRSSKFADRIMMLYICVGIWGAMLLDCLYADDQSGFIYILVIIFTALIFSIGFSLWSAKYNKERRGNLCIFFVCTIFIMLINIGVSTVVDGNDEDYTMVDGQWRSVYNDDLLLTMEDLGISSTGYINRIAYNEGSPVMQKKEGYDSSENRYGHAFSYEVYTTKSQRIYDMTLEQRYFENYKLKKVHDSSFTAKEVYFDEKNDIWVLLYPDRIVGLDVSFDLSEKQKQVIEEKLAS